MPPRRPVEGVRQKMRHHNGRESREMLLLWKGDRRNAAQKVYSRMTVTSRAPWAPMTRACSMSAVLEGPAMKLPKS